MSADSRTLYPKYSEELAKKKAYLAVFMYKQRGGGWGFGNLEVTLDRFPITRDGWYELTKTILDSDPSLTEAVVVNIMEIGV